MTQLIVALALAGVSVGARDLRQENRPRAENPVVAWNRALLAIVRTTGAQPATIHPTRSFAILHTAIYDAVNAIDRTHAPYLVDVPDASRSASQGVAANVAAHDVLVSLYPAFAPALDAQLQQALDGDPRSGEDVDGERIGHLVAREILAARSDDGANAAPAPYVFGTAPGTYQSTPPNFAPQPQFTQWRFVTPFALPHANLFRPGAPPALTSPEYAASFNEVQSVGVQNGAAASPDEMQTGFFWNGAIQNYWNEIAQTAALERHLSIAESARLFALLNISLADGVIAFYDAKYTYNLWRPVTAIRGADADDNPATLADPAWLPETGKTAPDPSYPGAHAVISAAAAEVLREVLKTDRFDLAVTSETQPGAVRSFTRFSDAATEASLSRVFAGQHFRFDQAAGSRLGHDVAEFVVAHELTRKRPHDQDGR